MNASIRNNGSSNGAPRGANVFRSIQRVLIVPVLPLLMSGCATETDFLAQTAALRTAENRARFELTCPQVTSSILSQKVIEGLRLGYEWTEYTIGVRGCGKQAVYVTECRDEDNCNALSQTHNAARHRVIYIGQRHEDPNLKQPCSGHCYLYGGGIASSECLGGVPWRRIGICLGIPRLRFMEPWLRQRLRALWR